MILLNFDTWNSKHGYFLSWRRIYRNGKWTPFCHVGKRYSSWLGYWKAPKSVSWTLEDNTLIFSGIPSDAQIQTLTDLLKTFGLVPTGNARVNNNTHELSFEPAPGARTYRGFYGESITVAPPTTYELFIGPAVGPDWTAEVETGPDWEISVPDGHANTASITYKGKPFNVISADLHLQADEAGILTLKVWTHHLEAVMNALDIEIEVVPCK